VCDGGLREDDQECGEVREELGFEGYGQGGLGEGLYNGVKSIYGVCRV
jgi:hypothetical protein